MRVLVVEDSNKLRETVAQALREAGNAVDEVADGKDGLIYACTTEYDVVVLDLGLPLMDGMDVLRTMRERQVKSPVLILTARDAVEDCVGGLQSGADDYLIKPFALAELLARVQALARRAHGVRTAELVVGQLHINTISRSAHTAGKRPIALTPREYAVLEYLAHRAGQPVTRAELEEHLYDSKSQVWSNAIESAISAIRVKLEAASCSTCIRTRRKIGYVLSEASA